MFRKIELIRKLNLLISLNILIIGDNMAKPIAPTPILKGNDLKEFIKERKTPMTENEKRVSERVKKAKDIPFIDF